MGIESPTLWAICLDAAEAAQLGRLRLVPGLRICSHDGRLWLRGDSLDDGLDIQLRSLPGAIRFHIQPDEQLTAWDETVPCSRLPHGEWLPLASWLQPTPPRVGFAAHVENSVALKLIRSTEPTVANVLKTTWPAWCEYVATAPQVRLNRWSCAVSDSGEVLVRGTPLPPLPGQTFIERAGVAIPAGWRLEPDVDPATVRSVLKLADGDLALFASEGSFATISDSSFVHVTRSAVRLTEERRAHQGSHQSLC